MTMIVRPQLAQCPLKPPLGVIGKKWTLQIIRDIESGNAVRFGDLSVSISGITRRMLSTRLSQLSKEGIIEKSRESQSWKLTPKGKDLLKVLAQIVLFRLKWDADRIFNDKQPRSFEEVLQEWNDRLHTHPENPKLLVNCEPGIFPSRVSSSRAW